MVSSDLASGLLTGVSQEPGSPGEAHGWDHFQGPASNSPGHVRGMAQPGILQSVSHPLCPLTGHPPYIIFLSKPTPTQLIRLHNECLLCASRVLDTHSHQKYFLSANHAPSPALRHSGEQDKQDLLLWRLRSSPHALNGKAITSSGVKQKILGNYSGLWLSMGPQHTKRYRVQLWYSNVMGRQLGQECRKRCLGGGVAIRERG